MPSSIMKSLFLILATTLSIQAGEWSSLINPELNEAWENYKLQYNKVYLEEKEDIRRGIWEENLKIIQRHNILHDLGKRKYTLGVNEFADLTNQEFRDIYLKYGTVKSMIDRRQVNKTLVQKNDLPDTVNWVKKGYVTKVKNQAQCGSCWAFSTTGSLEGQHFRKTKKLLSLSEQQLVDCSGQFGNEGCNGGLMDNAFRYIMKYGLEKESVYPYTAQDGDCTYSRSKVVAHCKRFKDVDHGDEDALAEAVAKIGPISVAIDASHTSFQLYKSGVYDEENCSSDQLDHGVLAVGYGTDDDSNEKYWLVKNSWGATWGMKGYIMMSKDKDNQCGIATMASYPIV